MEWISVEDRLPSKDNSLVLVTHKNKLGLIKLATFVNKLDLFYLLRQDGMPWGEQDFPINVTHWCEVPVVHIKTKLVKRDH